MVAPCTLILGHSQVSDMDLRKQNVFISERREDSIYICTD
jgi:hypothetical protein